MNFEQLTSFEVSSPMYVSLHHYVYVSLQTVYYSTILS